MITDVTLAGDQAQFSDDRKLRYHLLRILKNKDGSVRPRRRIAFCMLNPSTADAFENDNTIKRCIKFAWLWGGTELEVVNLFAFRTPHPKVLKSTPADQRGTDGINDQLIIDCALRSDLFICGWGADGDLAGRGPAVAWMLRERQIAMHHLGTSANGSPKHPLARGKSFIPYTQQPIAWDLSASSASFA